MTPPREGGEVRCMVRGEPLVLLPERAALLPEEGTLLVADAHWGKAATFRSLGVPVPRGTTGGGLARLDAALRRTGAQRIVFLGDFLHARRGRAPGTLDTLRRWREANPSLDLLLVRGNHDRGAGDPPDELEIRCVDPPHPHGPWVFAHHPVPDPGGYVLAGHLHPGVRLRGGGRMRARLPCFWMGEEVAVLPAFGEFTGLAEIEPTPDDRIFVVAEGEVVEVGKRERGRGNREQSVGNRATDRETR